MGGVPVEGRPDPVVALDGVGGGFLVASSGYPGVGCDGMKAALECLLDCLDGMSPGVPVAILARPT